MKHLVMSLCVILISVVSISAVKGECGGACIIDNFIKLTRPDEINRFIAGGADVNARDSTGQTALMMFARNHKKPETIQALIDAGADVNARTKNGRTALEYAIRNQKDLAVAKILMQAGANPSLLEPSSKRTLLASVFRAKDTDTLQAMLAAGLDVNEKDDYSDPALYRAVDGVNHDMVKLLLKAGADVNAGNRSGETALYRAVGKRSSKILQALIDAGADVNVRYRDYTALGVAVSNAKDLTIARMLIKAGANPSLLYRSRKSKLLSLVFRTNDTETMRAMIAAGFDVNEKDSGRTVLQRAASNASHDMVKVLLKAGADVKARTERGWTALDNAVSHRSHGEGLDIKDLAVVRVLLKAGADLSRLRSEYTLLDSVFRINDTETLQTMIDAGLNTDTAFHYAVEVANPGIVKFLLKAGANVNARGRHGKTALMTAAAWRIPETLQANIEECRYHGVAVYGAAKRSPEILQTLTVAGADVNALNEGGRTALGYTIELRRSGRDEIDTAKAFILLKAGADLSLLDEPQKSELLTAAFCTKDTELFRAMIAGGLDLNKSDPFHSGPFWKRALNEIRDPETFQQFIDAGLDIATARDQYGNTALHLVEPGKTDEGIIRALLKSGAAIMARNDNEEIVLHRLLRKIKDPITIEALVNAAGPDIKTRDEYGRTALHAAVGNTNNMVKALVAAGLDVNARDDFKATVLMHAADHRGAPEIFRTLIDAGADVNAVDKNGRTALHRVIYNPREDKSVEYDRALLARKTNIAKVLIHAGADLNAREADGKTPLFYAVLVHNSPMIDALLKAGADVNVIRKGEVRTVLAFALRAMDRRLAKKLLKAGADISLLDNNERKILNELGLEGYRKS